MKCLYYRQCSEFEHEKIICCFAYSNCRIYKQNKQEAVEQAERKMEIKKQNDRDTPMGIGSLL